MKPTRSSWFWHSFRVKAVLTATLSLALVLAILFIFSSIWVRREELAAQQRRSQDVLRHLASSLQLVGLVGPDRLRPLVVAVPDALRRILYLGVRSGRRADVGTNALPQPRVLPATGGNRALWAW